MAYRICGIDIMKLRFSGLRMVLADYGCGVVGVGIIKLKLSNGP